MYEYVPDGSTFNKKMYQQSYVVQFLFVVMAFQLIFKGLLNATSSIVLMRLDLIFIANSRYSENVGTGAGTVSLWRTSTFSAADLHSSSSEP